MGCISLVDFGEVRKERKKYSMLTCRNKRKKRMNEKKEEPIHR